MTPRNSPSLGFRREARSGDSRAARRWRGSSRAPPSRSCSPSGSSASRHPRPAPSGGSQSIRPCRNAPFSRLARPAPGLKPASRDEQSPGMVRCSRFRSARLGQQVLPFSISIYIGAGKVDTGPVGWCLFCLLLWIIGFPAYLINRPKIKAAVAAASNVGGTPPVLGAASQTVQVSQAVAPPGWYADPTAPGQHRYWDGATWRPPASKADELSKLDALRQSGALDSRGVRQREGEPPRSTDKTVKS